MGNYGDACRVGVAWSKQFACPTRKTRDLPRRAAAIVPHCVSDALPMNAAVAVSTPLSRGLIACGAVCAAVGIALSAYAAHNGDDGARASLQTAALFAFGHGIALAALTPRATRLLARISLAMLLLGVVLFSGSLVAAHFHGLPTTLAPFGGGLMILAWLVFAADALRR